MMSKIRYAVVGSGWCSLFYIRIAKALPEMFELTALLCRSREKADQFRKVYGIRAVTSDREIIDSDPDFIVSAVSESSIVETAISRMLAGMKEYVTGIRARPVRAPGNSPGQDHTSILLRRYKKI